MTLEKFLSKNKIQLAESIKNLCLQGIETTAESVDPFHDIFHLYRIFDNLNRFLNETQEIAKEEVDFDTLLLAICWHDSWTVKKSLKNIFNGFLKIFWDGWGSMLVFNQATKKTRLDRNLLRKTKYLISNHHSCRFPLFQIKFMETKILVDMDRLDEWSLERIKKAEESLLKQYPIIPLKIMKIANFWLKKKLMKMNINSFHFFWSREEFLKRKPVFLRGIEKLKKEVNY